MSDLIERQAAISIPLTPKGLRKYQTCNLDDAYDEGWGDYQACVSRLPSAQPEPSIPISWIEEQINWLKSMDNYFSNLTAMNISVLVKKWRIENGKDE